MDVDGLLNGTKDEAAPDDEAGIGSTRVVRKFKCLMHDCKEGRRNRVFLYR
jgi:hypothetical protein